MNKNKDIHVFVCEDPAIAESIVQQHYAPGKVTYAGVYDSELKSALVQALHAVEEERWSIEDD